jgi:hypothetical protein
MDRPQYEQAATIAPARAGIATFTVIYTKSNKCDNCPTHPLGRRDRHGVHYVCTLATLREFPVRPPQPIAAHRRTRRLTPITFMTRPNSSTENQKHERKSRSF